MTIFSIGPGNPLLKLFGKERAEPSSPQESGNDAPGASFTAQDVVDISRSAQQRLDGVGTLSADRPDEVSAVAGEAREQIGQSGVSLGLDSSRFA